MYWFFRDGHKVTFFPIERVYSFQMFRSELISFSSSFQSRAPNLWNSKQVRRNRSYIGQTFEFIPHITTNSDLFLRHTFYIGWNQTIAVDRAEKTEWEVLGKSLRFITFYNFHAQISIKCQYHYAGQISICCDFHHHKPFSYKIEFIIEFGIKIWIEWCIF